jgi:hypothetical protein
MGELKGHQYQPREIAEFAYGAGWKDAYKLVTTVAVCLAESQGFARAYNDNVKDGVVISRDVGLWEINIPADRVGTSVEENLYDPESNANAAYDLWKRRGFQPWVAFNSGVYRHDSYIGRAAMGVGNFLGDKLLREPVPDHADGTPYEHHFTTPILNFQHRLVGCLAHLQQGRKLLGWKAAGVTVVGSVQTELAHGETAAKAPLP